MNVERGNRKHEAQAKREMLECMINAAFCGSLLSTDKVIKYIQNTTEAKHLSNMRNSTVKLSFFVDSHITQRLK